MDSTPIYFSASPLPIVSCYADVMGYTSLAWAEMYLLLAALVQGFNFDVKDATAADFKLERDNFGIGTRAGCNLSVYVAPLAG